MIELKGIKKSYLSKVVLADVSLSAAPGQILCLCGPSGCGKTTILEIAAGVLAPDEGERSCGTKRIGYAMQDDCLIPWLTVKENLLFALLSYYDELQALSIATEWLSRLGLEQASENKPSSLSGGMKRRTNLARAMAINPDLLLMDEPFAFQDEQNCSVIAKEIEALLSEIHCATILVSHTPVAQWITNARIHQLDRIPLVLSKSR